MAGVENGRGAEKLINQRGHRRVFTTFPYRTSSVTRCLYIVKYRGGGCLFPKLTPYVSPKVFQKERRARRGGLLALALPTSTLYTGIDSTVTYSRLGSTIQTVNGGGVVVLYLHRLTKSSAPAAARTCRSRCFAEVQRDANRRTGLYLTPWKEEFPRPRSTPFPRIRAILVVKGKTE